MRNILAIAGKELRGYFSSPIAYVVIGLFALIFGWFFYVPLSFFNRQSMQMSMGMGGTLNINQMLIAPMLTNAGVVILFLMPMITMRTYSEEKRSGTMELLLTSPLTDAQIILGKFLGVLGLYAAILGVTLFHVGILFIYGSPAWKPVVTGYLGLFLMGAQLPLGRPPHFEPDQESDRRRHRDLLRRADAVGDQLDGQLRWSDDAGGAVAPVDHGPSRRLRARSARHEAPGLLPQFHCVRAVPHREGGRQRTVAGLIRC